VPGGTDSEVGIAGLTLGGGNGWLMGLHGATCDNLLSADVVMADGNSLAANSSENGDLFWALRGGGGNFGIVTSFHYRLHPIVPMVIGGAVTYAYEDALEVLRHFRNFVGSASDALTVYACLLYDGGRAVVAIACRCSRCTLAKMGDDRCRSTAVDALRRAPIPLRCGTPGPST